MESTKTFTIGDFYKSVAKQITHNAELCNTAAIKQFLDQRTINDSFIMSWRLRGKTLGTILEQVKALEQGALGINRQLAKYNVELTSEQRQNRELSNKIAETMKKDPKKHLSISLNISVGNLQDDFKQLGDKLAEELVVGKNLQTDLQIAKQNFSDHIENSEKELSAYMQMKQNGQLLQQQNDELKFQFDQQCQVGIDREKEFREQSLHRNQELTQTQDQLSSLVIVRDDLRKRCKQQCGNARKYKQLEELRRELKSLEQRSNMGLVSQMTFGIAQAFKNNAKTLLGLSLSAAALFFITRRILK